MASISIGFLSPHSTWVPSASLQKKQTPTSFFSNNHLHSFKTITHSFIPSPPSSSSSSRVFSRRWVPSLATAEPQAPSLIDSESDSEQTELMESDSQPDSEPTQRFKVNPMPKGEEVFAVVMIGSRQYIVFPGRFLYTQRLKGANVNDKIILSKVLLVGTKTHTYIGKPVVQNAVVHAVVEEQGLNDKVIVFKYKKKKNYRRNIGHRQPNTRMLITGVTGYHDYPAAEHPVPAQV
ncbi:ribosomal protein L21 [Tasmannia lanceolata]|uniref:ribosomal protein L21 n=1 Tax=Tasmannia lanceolata TaxID=3420 RepID=UPI0040643E54